MNHNSRIQERKEGKTLGVVGFPQNGDIHVPGVRVQGKWLSDFGFNLGDKVVLTASNGLIVIRKERGNGKDGN